MNKNLHHFAAYMKADKIDQNIISSLRIALGIIGSILLGIFSQLSWEGKSTPFTLVITSFGLTVMYLVLEYRKAIKEKLFPLQIIDQLSAVEELKELNKRYSRKENIDKYISSAIYSLNTNTCSINGTESNQLCHNNINESLMSVTSDIVRNTQYFLDCDCKEFTVAVFIKTLYDPNWKPNQTPEMEREKLVFEVLRDDFNLMSEFTESTENIEAKSDSTYYVMQKIQESIDRGKFISEKNNLNENDLSIVFSPIPNVCEGCPPDGVIMIVSRQKETPPHDLENILKIYGQIISNWVSKFNDCVDREKKINEYFTNKNTQIVTDTSN